MLLGQVPSVVIVSDLSALSLQSNNLVIQSMVKHFHKVTLPSGDTGVSQPGGREPLPHHHLHRGARLHPYTLEHLGRSARLVAAGWPPPAGRAVVRQLTACASSIFSLGDKSFSVWNRSFITRRMHRLLCEITHTQTHTTIISV